jgi:RNA-directed DNA polymerase
LRLSELKTKIVYCLDYNRTQRKDYSKKFDFLGFTFKPHSVKSKTGRGMFLGFGCVISQKSQTRIVRFWKELKLHRKSPLTIKDIADKLNFQIRGIIRYYGYSTIRHLQGLFRNLEFRLAKWYRNKYKERSYCVAFKRIRDIKINYPTMFYHWQFFQTI